jgi:group I intron endonuclease
MKILTKNVTYSNSGIYKITNKITNNFYIGSSCKLKLRYNRHKCNLLSNTHLNFYLQQSVNKYGIENLTFELLELCNVEVLLEREQYYIDTLNPKYNIVRDVSMRSMTQEVKDKISSTVKESYKNGRARPLNLTQRRAIVKYSAKGEYLETFSSLAEAAKSVNVCKSSVYKSCRNNNWLSGGYKWQYDGEPFNYIPPIVVVDLELNKQYSFQTFTEAEKFIGVNKGVIARTLFAWGNGIVYKNKYSFHSRNIDYKKKKKTWERKEPKYNKVLLNA